MRLTLLHVLLLTLHGQDDLVKVGSVVEVTSVAIADWQQQTRNECNHEHLITSVRSRRAELGANSPYVYYKNV